MSSIYPLSSALPGDEKQRLNDNHRVYRHMTEGDLLPVPIQTYVQSLPAPVIADIGTGTGIWLQEISREMPKLAQLHGYDIDGSKFPVADSVSPNVTFRLHDALLPFHKELHAKYDVVHVRLLYLALKKEDWAVVAANIRTILKPGGWIHWEELGYPGFTCLPISKSFYEFMRVEVSHAIHVGRDPLAPTRLMLDLQDQGFARCDRRTFNSLSFDDVHVTKAVGKGMVTMIEGCMGYIVSRGGYMGISTRDDIVKLVTDLQKDLNNGSVVGVELWWAWGRRPY
ncbi:Methyltransferase domain-containing protein [Fusarium pseudocircinatum]|uniref:Methyltransferase domain-containing protein n=1 Tax=Fusarium pseudocircinatum TaxID=56676 RepID=A0A8H5KJR7_9HYPO|nr:Methyltransferase domain-containing protein [Fusarium pseudocircinatum]